jgi:hypothetical protein
MNNPGDQFIAAQMDDHSIPIGTRRGDEKGKGARLSAGVRVTASAAAVLGE